MYITEKTGKFGGDSAEDQREVMRWMFWDNHKMSSQAGMTRFLMNFLPEDKRPQEVIAIASQQQIIVAVRHQNVIPRAAVQGVIPMAAVQVIGIIATRDHIVTLATIKHIRP